MRLNHVKLFILLAVSAALTSCGEVCPVDTQLAPVTSTSKSFPDAVTCEAARALPNSCPQATAPDSACISKCTSGWWPCIAKVTNPSSASTGACVQNPADGQFHYACTAKATCQCN